MTAEQFWVRFWSRVDKHVLSRVAHLGPCWLWLGPLTRNGYAPVRVAWSIRRKGHALVFEAMKGPLPSGLELDHLCRRTNCVNPDHLEPVTHEENVRRGESICAKQSRQTHCVRGHALTEDNLVLAKLRRGIRECATCKKARDDARDRRRTCNV